MNVVKCVNGHFFDSDSYSACPHCGGALSTVTQSSAEPEKPKKKGLFGGWKKNSENSAQNKAVQNSYAPKINSVTASNPAPVFAADEKTDSLPVQNLQSDAPWPDESTAQTVPDPAEIPAPPVSQAPPVHNVDHTSSLWQDKNDESRAPGIITSQQNQSSSENAGISSSSQTQNTVTQENGSSVLADEIRKASANSEGKTASYFSAVNAERKSASSGTAASQPEITDPVVGWLVCIEGPHFGGSFNISAGKNSIGRNDSNRIILSKDSAVSRDKHALIVYEPKKRNFFIQPGESSGLTYLNEDYITESKKLSARDIIELGSSKLMFVPLCDETFTWEDYITKE